MNPRAGSFTASDESALRTLAAENGLTVIEVRPGLDVRTTVRETIGRGLRSIVVAGGDGSIHHVIQALVNTEGILGIIPIGSVNHLARDLEIPLDWRAAFEVVLRGETRQIDVGLVNGRYFLNSIMLGIYPTMTAYRERFRSTHSKWVAYAKAFRLALRQFPHVTLVVEMDDRVETMRTQMFTVAVNSYDLAQVGLISPKTTFNDGRLSMYSISFMSRGQFIAATARFLRGRVADIPGFRSVRTRQLRIDTPRRKLRISVDGEVSELETPLQIGVVPASLLVRAPR
jgi:diacylglycerol kinase family enzyme